MQKLPTERRFPNLRSPPRESELYRILNLKYVERMIMRDGPVADPSEFFFLPKPRKKDFDLDIILQGPIDLESVPRTFVHPASRRTPQALAEMIITAPGAYVLKPNKGALGEAIYFIERVDEMHYNVHTKMPRSGLDQRYLSGGIVYFQNQGLLNEYEDNNLLTISLSGSPSKLREYFTDLLRWCTITDMPNPRTPRERPSLRTTVSDYLVESFVDLWKYHGCAYETRYHIRGDVESEEVHGLFPDIARIGGSSFLSNQTDLRFPKQATELNAFRIHDPLYEVLVNRSAQTEFEDYVNNLLRATFLQYARVLKNEGIKRAGRMHLQIDFAWMQSQTPRAFPKPFLTEITYSPVS